MGTDDQDQRATETGDGTGQCALLARGMPEDDNKEQRPPYGSAHLARAATNGAKEGRDPSPSSMGRRCTARSRMGEPQTWQRATLARGQGI